MRYKAVATTFNAAHERIDQAEAVAQSPTDASRAAEIKVLHGDTTTYWTSVEVVITIDS